MSSLHAAAGDQARRGTSQEMEQVRQVSAGQENFNVEGGKGVNGFHDGGRLGEAELTVCSVEGVGIGGEEAVLPLRAAGNILSESRRSAVALPGDDQHNPMIVGAR